MIEKEKFGRTDGENLMFTIRETLFSLVEFDEHESNAP